MKITGQLLPNKFCVLKSETQSRKVFAYSNYGKLLDNGNLVLQKIHQLPLATIYTLHLASEQGIKLGLAFTSPCKKIVVEEQSLRIERGTFKSIYPLKQVLANKKQNVELKFSIDNMRIYSYLDEAMLIVPLVTNLVTQQLDKV